MTSQVQGARAEETRWETLEPGAVLMALGSSAETGLSAAEVARRQEMYGRNELPETPPRPLWRMVLQQFKDALVLILAAAAVSAGFLGELQDAGLILAVVAINAVLGAIQEAKAEKSLAALKRLSRPTATVLREGRTVTVPSAELVPGDIVLLEAGDSVPADLRLLEAFDLRIDESALTGESVPVEKGTEPIGDGRTALGDRLNMAFRGTNVAYGRGKGVVVATGLHTELGRISRLLAQEEAEPTPLQKRLAALGKVLAAVALALVGAVFAAGVARGGDPLEMFLTAISLAVAVVPEGLPAVVTVVLALGVQRLSRRKAIIRRLPAVETLGSATVICTDKTGTLTENRMTVVRAWADGVESSPPEFGLHLDPERLPDGTRLLLTGLALASDAVLTEDGGVARGVGDPTEVALVVAAARAGLAPGGLAVLYPRLDELPFDSARKRMTTLHRLDSEGRDGLKLPGEPGEAAGCVAFTKGGFDALLPLCTHLLRDGQRVSLTDADRAGLQALNESLAGEALRVLALAYRTFPECPDRLALERELTFVGLVGLSDPPRAEVAAAITEAQRAGIRTVMITGDHRATAAAIARRLGIMGPKDAIVTGPELDDLSEEGLARTVERAAVFARVAPEHKLRIVKALKARGHIVAMTGDGVNDAPALKRADIGAAMGVSGTDVAREAADVVLADDNYATVVAAVREGRTIYENIRKAVQYLLSCNAGELFAILTAVLAGLGRPLTALQILWTNLVTDSLPALALGMEPPEPGVMSRPPRPAAEGIFARGLGWLILVEGALIGALPLAGYGLTLAVSGNRAAAGTVAFATLSLCQLVHAFNTRSPRVSLFKLGLFSNPSLVWAFVISLALLLMVLLAPPLQSAFDVVPLTAGQWRLVLGLALVPLALGEVRKWVSRRA
ncbi:MAG TPA: cation-translocating P-type ATPase [Firmicutes bacterium]|nr:cation-translocating P-type ATPase [Bacillota bacterium]